MSDSTKKALNHIFEEQEQVSKAFQMDNFYTNQRLNIVELKERLQKFKNKNRQSLPLRDRSTPIKEERKEQSNHKMKPLRHFETPQVPRGPVKGIKYRSTGHKEQSSLIMQEQFPAIAEPAINNDSFIRAKQEEVRKNNYRILREVKKARYDAKISTGHGSRHHSIIEQKTTLNPISHVRNNSKIEKKQDKSDHSQHSRCSDASRSWSIIDLNLQGKLKVQTVFDLNELEKQIRRLWQHYQLLTSLLLGIKQGSKQYQNIIVKYIQDTCSDKFEFVKEILGFMQQTMPSRQQSKFIKRVRKTVTLSRLLENLSIVYVSLDICHKRQPDSHTVNFVGYCCSNVIFLLRLLDLTHSMGVSMNYTQSTIDILSVIAEFQVKSYGSQLRRITDLILRMEHNNDTINIVQSRLCGKMAKEFQQTIGNFLKRADLEVKPFLECSHYIYQFLAFHLAKNGLVGEFSSVQMAPSPYVSLPVRCTLVIEPWQVLFAVKGANIYIRAYAETFLTEVGKHWNIVYWTDTMPQQIDELTKKLPEGHFLYRYHCRYQNQRYIKLLSRLGSDIDNTIIIDRQSTNYKYDRQMGLDLPWKGKSKDAKLLEVLHLLTPLFNNNTISLRKSFPVVRQQIASQRKHRRNSSHKQEPGSRSESRQAEMPETRFSKGRNRAEEPIVTE